MAKVSADGGALVYSTFLGGSVGHCERDPVDMTGAAYVTGETRSTYFRMFPTANSLDRPRRRRDAFVTKVSASGTSLVYSTYLGGAG